MTDKVWFLNNVLSEWEYKEVYVNGRCVYSVDGDTEVTLNNVKEMLEAFSKLCVVSWRQIHVTPYKNGSGVEDGVVVRFEFEVSFW